jgi:hypothetical protein
VRENIFARRDNHMAVGQARCDARANPPVRHARHTGGMKKPIDTTHDKTEAQLQALIVQCQEMVRTLVLPAAAAADSDSWRVQYLRSAMEIVQTGAQVGDSIARLRGGGAGQHRQHITVERINTVSSGDGEGG